MSLENLRFGNRIGTTLAMLTGGVLTLVASTGARAETVYITEPAPYAAAPGYVTAPPGTVYDAPVVTRRTIVTGPSVAVVPATRTVVVQRPPAYVIERPTGFVTTSRFYDDRRIYAAPSARTYVAPGSGMVGVEYSAPTSCSIDINGFERCY